MSRRPSLLTHFIRSVWEGAGLMLGIFGLLILMFLLAGACSILILLGGVLCR